MFKPQQFGKYYLTERIAVGGMAEIYKAKLYGVSGFEKPMVVKQILPQYARNVEFIKMFIDEAKISVSLSHGNIIPVYELGRIDGVYYIAMEYVDGKSVAEILETAAEKNKPLSVEHAIFITIEICKGLDYAHRRTDDEGTSLGVVHRDLSPSNILITRGGEVKIVDFGIAKATDKLGVTAVGVIKGSHGYMAPEQVQGLEVDGRSDIFTTGVLLHEMLTGRHLFEGSDANVIERIKKGIVTLPSMVAPEVPVELDPVTLQALARLPEDRYQTANELQLALSRLLFSIGAGATSTTLADYINDMFPKVGKSSSHEIDLAPPPDNFETRRALEPITTDIDEIDDDGDLTLVAGTDATRAYAIRDELQQLYDERIANPQEIVPATAQTTSPAKRPVPPPPETSKGHTLNLPALDDNLLAVEDEGPTTVRAPIARPKRQSISRSASHPDDEDEPETRVLSPVKPKVPELKIKAAAPRGPRLDDSLSSFSQALHDNATAEPHHDKGVDHDVLFGDTTANPRRSIGSSGQNHSAKRDERDDDDALATTVRASSREMVTGRQADERQADERQADERQAEERQAEERQATPNAMPDPSKDPRVIFKPGKKRGPRSDASVMALLVPSGATSEEEAIGPDVARLGRQRRPSDALLDPLGDSTSAKERASAEDGPHRRRRQTSGVFSSTMQMLVQGLDEEPELTIPRRIKPTVLGWIVILAVVFAAGFFVILKKTTWLGGKAPGAGGALLNLDDIKSGSGATSAPTAKKTTKKGDIALAATPSNAWIFLHVGDSPTKRRVDKAKTYLLRVEREGYGTVNKIVDPAILAAGTVSITLPPQGAGQAPAFPSALPTATPPSGKTAELAIITDPPSASVWLLVGQGKTTLTDVKPARHYFKIIAKSYQTSFVSISASRFDTTSHVSETIALTPRAGNDAQTTQPDAGRQATKPKTVKAPKVPTHTPKKATGKKHKRHHRRRHRRRRQPKLQTPSWAR